jgi:GxxExxY protein
MNKEINQLTEQIIGAAIEVHRELGPGLLESAYQRALAHELRLCKIAFEEQKLCPVKYKDLIIDDAYRLDFPCPLCPKNPSATKPSSVWRCTCR